MKNKAVFSALACGVISAALDFWLIPSYFARGIPDYIWMTLMVVMPLSAALFLLREHPVKVILWSFGVQVLLVLVFSQPIGNLLGYRLGRIAYDLFDYIGYFLFCFGWILAATAAQFVSLILLKKYHT